MFLSRASYYKRGIDWSKRDGPLIEALNVVIGQHGRWGFWKCYGGVKLDGHSWNHKRVYRVYCAMGLNLKRRTKKRVPVRERQSIEAPNMPNRVWSLDFMSDTLYSGRRFRILNVLDEGVREALNAEYSNRHFTTRWKAGTGNGRAQGVERASGGDSL